MKKTFQLSTLILFAVNGGLAFSQTLCELEPDPGPCFAAIQAYYFNADSQSCAQFTWGGCDGIVPFWTLEECQSACGSGVFNPSELCDSIHVSLSSVIQPDMGVSGVVTISMSTSYTTNYMFPYSGFQLVDNEGLMLASEELSSAPNVYGIGPFMNEIRYLILPSELPSYFSGKLNLVSGLFAGFPEVVCSYPFTWSDPSTSGVDLYINDVESTPGIEFWYDFLGRQLLHGPTRGQLSIAVYSDGSRKAVWKP